MPDAIIAKRSTSDLASHLSRVDRSGRWVPVRKQILLELIRRGSLTVEQACIRYDLSAEELQSWRRRDAVHGRSGLSVTKLQQVGR